MRINPISLYQNRINTSNTQKNNTSKPVSFSGKAEVNKNHFAFEKAEKLKQEFQQYYEPGLHERMLEKDGVKEYSAACGKEYVTLDDACVSGNILRKTGVFEDGKLYEVFVSTENYNGIIRKEAYYFDTSSEELKEYKSETKEVPSSWSRLFGYDTLRDSESSITQTYYKF